MNQSADLPLRGIKVLDLSRILAGPLCSMMLSDLGADVLKLEPPGGDETRRWGPPFIGGESAYFLGLNRNKASVVADLSTPAGQELLVRLLERADVFLDNFRPGTLAGWGFSDTRIAELNPRVVHCSITGFGTTGPYRDFPGFDPVIEAMSGLMSTIGPAAREEPYKVGVAIVDVLAALHASTSISALLHRRHTSGSGGRLEVSLLDVAIASLANVGSAYLISGEVPGRYGNDHPSIVPFGAFKTSDGEVMICAGTDRQWQTLCQVIGLDYNAFPELTTNPQRVARRETVRDLIEHRIAHWMAADLSTALMKAGVPAGPINNVAQAFEDPHVKASEIVQTLSHPNADGLRVVGPPVIVDGSRPRVQRAPPRLGEPGSAVEEWLA